MFRKCREAVAVPTAECRKLSALLCAGFGEPRADPLYYCIDGRGNMQARNKAAELVGAPSRY